VTVRAAYGSANQSTAAYQMDVAGTGKAFTYDTNGNLTGDGARAFEWEAENGLIAVNIATPRVNFVRSSQ
jgi:hypothetical protein